MTMAATRSIKSSLQMMIYRILATTLLFCLVANAKSATASNQPDNPTAKMADPASFLRLSLALDSNQHNNVVRKGQKLHLKATLENTSNSNVTFLKWNTPLDPLAPVTGVFAIRNLTAQADVNTDIIQVSRKMPPTADQLVEIAPHASVEEAGVVFKSLGLVSGHRYSVQAKGWWMEVWQLPKAEVVANHVSSSGAASGDFESNTVVFDQE